MQEKISLRANFFPSRASRDITRERQETPLAHALAREKVL